MDVARKLLDEGKPREALERLKELLPTIDGRDEWQLHELIGAAFHDLCNAEGAAQAYFNAARTDRFLRSQRAHFSNWLFALHYLPQLDAPTLANELAVYNSLYRDVEPLHNADINYFLSTAKESSKESRLAGAGIAQCASRSSVVPLRAASNASRVLTAAAAHPWAAKCSVAGWPVRIAFIAPNFCDSSAARFYEALLTDYDREKFSVTAWSMSHEEDAFTQTIRRNVDGYFDIAEESFAEAAQKIRDAGTEILIDLGGHTEGGATLQVAAYRPARVQMSGIGYFDSTGLAAIDYFIGDEFLTAGDTTFTEKILPLKNAFAFRPNARMVRERHRRRKIPHRHFTFASLNNFMKLSDDYLAAVKKILDALPDARIFFRDTTPLASRQRALIERLETFGIDADVRRGTDNFFADYSEADLILDAFPYPGGMMTALALYMGVPVLNLRGELASRRTGADVLHIAGLDELIVTDVDAYIEAAVALANDSARSAALTGKISVDKLTDTKTFVDDFYARLEAI